MTHEDEVVCRQARAEARARGRDTYVVTWIDDRVTWQRRIDQIDRLFAQRITRIAPDGQRTVETGRLRAPLPCSTTEDEADGHEPGTAGARGDDP